MEIQIKRFDLFYLSCHVSFLINMQEGYWVTFHNEQLIFKSTIPGFLNCSQRGTLPGCLFKYDNENTQCTSGRTG